MYHVRDRLVSVQRCEVQRTDVDVIRILFATPWTLEHRKDGERLIIAQTNR